MKQILNSFLIFLFLLPACGGGGSNNDKIKDTRSSWIVHWNKVAIDASGLDHTPLAPGELRVFGEQMGPVRSARAMAIIHIAIADSVAVITGKFDSYLPVGKVSFNNTLNSGLALKAAIAKAGHDTLVALYPSQAAKFDFELLSSLTVIEEGLSKELGLKIGQERAALILSHRQDDGSDLSEPYANINYQPSQLPGKWRPDPLNPNQTALGSNWSKVKPFVINSAIQFRIPPPPAFDSKEYAEAYNEVYRLGGDGVNTPTERTEDQTIAGIYWAYDGTPSLCAPPRLYNQIAVQIALDHGYSIEELARLLAIVNVGMADEGLVNWESKYFYEYWRPIIGIREADSGTGPTGLGDNNSLTVGDKDFTPLGAPASNRNDKDFTPPFPSYPSGHAGFGGFLFQTLREEFGTDDIKFSFVSDEYNGETRDINGNTRPLISRTFNNLSEAENENALSRLYLGIHWRFDAVGGINQGRQVASYINSRIYKRK